MPVVGYNAEEIMNYYDRRPLVVGWRLNKLSLPLLGKDRMASMINKVQCTKVSI